MMEKTEYYVGNNEFQIIIHKKDNIVFLNIFSSHYTVTFELSLKMWKNILKFLEHTYHKRYLPKEAFGFQGYLIEKNKPFYYEKLTADIYQRISNFISRKRFATNEDFLRWRKMQLKRQELYDKRNEIDIKRCLLDKFIYLEQGHVSIRMARAKFVRFRKFCLNANKHFTRPKIKEQFK